MVDLREITEEFLTYLRVEKNTSVCTDYAYRADLNRLAEFMEKQSLKPEVEAVSQPIVHKYLISLGQTKNYHPSTVARKVNALRSFFNYCMDQDYILVSPMRKIKPPKKPKRIPIYLKPGEFDRLLRTPDFMQEDDLWMQDKLMLNVFGYTGVRRAELLGLNWEDLDFKAASLKVRGKGQLERILPVKENVLDLAWEYLQTRLPLGNKAMFINAKGNRLDRCTLQDRFRKCVKKAVLDPTVYTPHKLRHTFATNLLNAGVDLVTIQELMGHLDPGSTHIYTHTDASKKREAVNKLK